MQNFQEEGFDDSISLTKQIQVYTKEWKWFLLSTLCSIGLAFVYLRYAQAQYYTLATILIKDPSESRGLSELAAFSDMGGLRDMGSSDIHDEVEILKSKTIIGRVISDLNININQYAIGKIKNSSIYGASPVNILYNWDDSFIEDEEKPSSSFELSLGYENEYEILDLASNKKYKGKYGKKLQVAEGELIVNKSDSFEENKQNKDNRLDKLLISVVSVSKYTEYLQNAINVTPKSKRSSVIDLSMRSTNKLMARDILNRLVYQYNQQAVDDKNLISLNTSKFIAERLNIISKELNEVEFQKASFKKQNKLTDIQSEAQQVVDQVGKTQEQISNIETQLSLAQSMIDYLINPSRESDLLPSNIGIDNAAVNAQISEYNKVVLERNRLLDVSTPLNPLVVNLNSDIDSQKLNLLESLKNQKSNFLIAKRNILKQKGRISSKMSGMPSQEKDYRAIERKQSIKETLYLFLLQKREETSISMAVTAPVAKIVDRAYSTVKPVAPKKKIILFGSFLIGLLIPFGFIYIKDLLDTKVNEKADLDAFLPNVTVLVEAPRIKKGDSDILALNDRSVLGESFRILRTNLNYFAKEKRKESKALRVFVTSTVKGEGKTFISFNTILSLADARKKVLVIGADIRNPQLHRYFKNSKDVRGLSEYLYDDELKFEDVLSTTTINNHAIDYVAAGRIPPNPSELLMNGRLEQLLDEAENDYDYIVIDTAPTMLVTDTLLLTETADVTMYVVRAGYTEKELLGFTKGLIKDGKIKNLALVLNDVDQGKVGYGYGYGYGAQRKTFFQKIFRK